MEQGKKFVNFDADSKSCLDCADKRLAAIQHKVEAMAIIKGENINKNIRI